jgi:WD40 repeat protein
MLSDPKTIEIRQKLNYFIPKSTLLSSQYKINLSKSLNHANAYNSSNHRLTQLLQGHLGCVNTLNWSQDGSLLLSGSDDQSLIIHKYIPGEQTQESFKLKTRFQTAHTNNIFDAKFNPGKQEIIVSAAADGRVCIIDDWEHRGFNELNTRTLIASSTDDAKRLEFIDENVFLVGCEDGHIIQFDLRESKPVKRIKMDLSDQQVGIHSISKCPSAPHLLAVAGSDPFVRIYDLRGTNENSTYTWTPPLKLGKKANFATGVKFSRFGYSLAINCIKDGPYLIDPIAQTESTSVDFLERLGIIKEFGLKKELEAWRVVQAAYKSGQFNLAESHLRSLILQHKSFQNDPNWCQILAHEIFNRILCLGQSSHPIPESETIKEDLLMAITVLNHWPARYLLIMYIFSLGLIEHGGVMCELFLRANENVENEWTQKLEQVKSIAAVCEIDPAQIPKLIPKNFSQACSDVPFSNLIELEATKRIISKGINGYLSQYPGVIHERTIKGVSFVGDSDQYIGVGSDGGYAFLYKTFNTPDESVVLPVWATKSDTSIVNVVEGHPFLPCIAVSGIDQTIKIWEPQILNSNSINSQEFKQFFTNEIPDLIQKLPNIQGINRLETLFDPFSMDPNALMFYLSSLTQRRF